LTTKISKYNPDDKKKPDALNYEDMCTFALSRFDSAPALKKYINEGGNLQLVFPSEIYGAWAKVMAQGRAAVPPWHFSITDRKGRGIIVQVRDGQVQALDNKYGVFANEPFLQENEKNTDEFEKKMLSNPPDVYPSVKAVMVPELSGPSVFAAGADKDIQFLPLPGDYSGPSRFTRMALTLKYATQPTCWDATSMLNKNEKETLNPAFVPSGGAPRTNQALLAVMGITNQVYLPRGMNDHGQAGFAGEWTPLQALRDHASGAYYLRTANSPLFRQYDMKKINWANTGKSGIVTVPLTTPGETWFVREEI
jgi:penicillin V acylase-like amidase (Ntn superfamily)